MSSAVAELPVPQHPVAACVAQLESLLSGVADVNPSFMRTAEKASVLVALTRVIAQSEGLLLRVLATAGDVAEEAGARDAGAWLAHVAHLDFAPARADLALAQALDQRWQQLGAAVSAGDVNTEQARVIARSLDELPDDLPLATLLEAESHLVLLARSFPPRQLRVLGRRVLDVIAPEVAEAEEAKRLADEEAYAAAQTRVNFNPLGDGTTRVTALVPDAVATRLRTYLESFAQPRVTADARSDRHDRLLGQAFCELLETLDPQRLPLHGGDATTVIVTMPLAQLKKDLGVASFGDTEKLTAAEARRLACTAHLIPAVLDGKGEILDLGRSRRLFSPAQRKALRVRDRQCRAHGCSVPGAWCDAHHRDPWSRGGATDLGNGVLLC